MLTLTNLLARVRFHSGVNDTSYASDAFVKGLINEAAEGLYLKVAKRNRRLVETSGTITLTGASFYTLRTTLTSLAFVNSVSVDYSGIRTRIKRAKLDDIEDAKSTAAIAPEMFFRGERAVATYQVRGGDIHLAPKLSSGTLYIYYVPVFSTIADAGTQNARFGVAADRYVVFSVAAELRDSIQTSSNEFLERKVAEAEKALYDTIGEDSAGCEPI